MANNGQTKTDLFGPVKVDIKSPDTSFNTDVNLETAIRDNFSEFAGVNAHWLRRELLTNTSKFEDVSRELFLDSVGEDELASLNEDPEAFNLEYNKFRKNFKTKLTENAYAGTPFSETLTNRTVEFSDKVSDVPVKKYINTLQNNKEKYKKAGLLDENGELIYGDSAFSEELLNNKGLHKEIVKDRFRDFQEELSEEHNAPSLFEGDPELLTTGWALYNKFGSEGLTQLVNYLQFGGDSEINESFTQKDEAVEFFKNAEINGKTPKDYIKEFVTGEKIKTVPNFKDEILAASTKYKVSPSLLASIVNTESSFNPDAIGKAGEIGLAQIMPGTGKALGFTKQDLRDPEKNLEASAKLMRELLDRHKTPELALAHYNATTVSVNRAVRKAKETGKDFKEFLPDSTQQYISKVLGGRENFVENKPQNYLSFEPVEPTDDLKKKVPKDTNNWMVDWYKSKKDHAEQIDSKYGIEKYVKNNFPELHQKFFNSGNIVRDGTHSSDYKKLALSVYEQAVKDNGFSIDDLVNTLLANKAGYEDKGGRSVYSIDYNGLGIPQRIAFDALQFDDKTQVMFENLGGGRYQFKPMRKQEYAGSWQDMKDFLFDTKKEMVKDENGNYSIKETPDTGLIGQVWNTAMTAAMGGADALLRYMVEPTLRLGNYISEKVGVGSETTKKYESALQGLLSTYQSEVTNRETDGIVPSTLGEAMPFLEYMGAMYAAGRATLGGASGLIRSITGSKKLLDTLRLGQVMKGSPRMAGISEKIWRGVSGKQPWATGFGVFYTGGAMVEGSQPENVSFFNVIPSMLGYDKTNDLTKLYNQTSDAGQVAMDVGASLVFDFLADSIVATARWGGSQMGRMFGKSKFASMSYDEASGAYLPTDTPQFKHDISLFWHNATRDLAKIPQGEVGESLAKNFSSKSDIKTVHDMVKVFSDESGEVVTGIKNELRKHIDWLQENLGDGVKLSDDQMDEMVEDQYSRFLSKVADQTYGVLKQANSDDPTDLPLRFAQALDEQAPVIREFRLDAKRVSPEDIPSLKEDGYNVIAKGDDVYEIDPKFWASDLASEIRARALKVSKDDVLERKLSQEGIDRSEKLTPKQSETVQRLSDRVNAAIGTPVRVGEKTGIIIDWDDAGFIARTEDGDVRTGLRFSEEGLESDVRSVLSEGELSGRETVAELQRSLRAKTRLLPARGQTTRPPQRLLPPPTNITKGDYVQGKISGFDRPRQILDVREVEGAEYVRLTGTSTYVPKDDLNLVRKAELTTPRATTQALQKEQELFTRFQNLDNELKEVRKRKKVVEDVVKTEEGQVNRMQQLNQIENSLIEQRRSALEDLRKLYEDSPELQPSRMEDNTIGTIRKIQNSFESNQPKKIQGDVRINNVADNALETQNKILARLDDDLLDKYKTKLKAFSEELDKASKFEIRLPYCR